MKCVLFPIAFTTSEDYTEPDEVTKCVLRKTKELYQNRREVEDDTVILITATYNPVRKIYMADVMKNHLLSLGVEEENIITQPAKTFDTDGETREAVAWIAENPNWKNIWIINKSWHMPRTRMLFWIHKAIFSMDVNVKYISVTSPCPVSAKTCVREFLKFPHNLLRLLLRQLRR